MAANRSGACTAPAAASSEAEAAPGQLQARGARPPAQTHTAAHSPEVPEQEARLGGGGGGGGAWWHICDTASLREDGRVHSKLGGRYITVFRHAGALFCIDSICYHAGGPLALGDIEDLDGKPVVKCPWHRCAPGSLGFLDTT